MEEKLSRQLTVQICDNTYKIDFPTIGKIIDVETRKTTLSSGMYGSMSSSMLLSTNTALDLIDSIAYFTTLIPELTKDLRVDSLMDLDPIQAKEIVVVLKKEFLPWYSKWIDVLKIDEEEKEVPKGTLEKQREEAK